MRRALTYLLVGTIFVTHSTAAERRSWNKIRYVGGTIAIKASPYDFNTNLTLTSNPDSIVIEIAPAKIFSSEQVIRLRPSQVVSLSVGPAAWRHVAEVPGAQLPARPPALFGVLQDRGYFGIVYDAEDGKRGAILLDSLFPWRILPALKLVTGKTPENSP